MSDKKLKPEHRKLWRRIYLDSFEGDGTSPEEAERMADKVVEQWEARGAFDDGALIDGGTQDTQAVLMVSKFGASQFHRIRAAIESKRPVTIDGVEAGFVTHWVERHDDTKPVAHLTLTVQSTFSLGDA
jgi:hypothetical protein